MKLPTAEEKPLLKIAEVAELTGLDGHHLYRVIARGEFPSVRVGRLLFVPTAALRRLLAVDDETPAAS